VLPTLLISDILTLSLSTGKPVFHRIIERTTRHKGMKRIGATLAVSAKQHNEICKVKGGGVRETFTHPMDSVPLVHLD
jgi:hypothetical protein